MNYFWNPSSDSRFRTKNPMRIHSIRSKSITSKCGRTAASFLVPTLSEYAISNRINNNLYLKRNASTGKTTVRQFNGPSCFYREEHPFHFHWIVSIRQLLDDQLLIFHETTSCTQMAKQLGAIAFDFSVLVLSLSRTSE